MIVTIKSLGRLSYVPVAPMRAGYWRGGHLHKHLFGRWYWRT